MTPLAASSAPQGTDRYEPLAQRPLVPTSGVGLEAEEDVGDAVGVGLAVAVGVDAGDEGGEGRFAVGGERGGRNDQEPLGVPGVAPDKASFFRPENY